MLGQTAKRDIIQQLQRDVLSLQGFKRPSNSNVLSSGLGAIESAFPNKTFPTGAVHEFISLSQGEAAATNGFIAGIISQLMQQKGACLWISTKRTIFPPALKIFGIDPERIIFVDISRQKDALWSIEEALKCEALGTVVGEVPELSFKESRRLQLAVEQSRVTGFIHRHNPRSENIVACVTRWKIKPLPSAAEDIPGVGFPRWHVQLLKVRNGKPGSWNVEWSSSHLQHVQKSVFSLREIQTRKTG